MHSNTSFFKTKYKYALKVLIKKNNNKKKKHVQRFPRYQKRNLLLSFAKVLLKKKIQIYVSHVLKYKFLLFAGTPEAPCIWTHPAAQIQTVKRKPFPKSETYCSASADFVFSLKEKKPQKQNKTNPPTQNQNKHVSRPWVCKANLLYMK